MWVKARQARVGRQRRRRASPAHPLTAHPGLSQCRFQGYTDWLWPEFNFYFNSAEIIHDYATMDLMHGASIS